MEADLATGQRHDLVPATDGVRRTLAPPQTAPRYSGGSLYGTDVACAGARDAALIGVGTRGLGCVVERVG